MLSLVAARLRHLQGVDRLSDPGTVGGVAPKDFLGGGSVSVRVRKRWFLDDQTSPKGDL
jgi:hypothetical protein